MADWDAHVELLTEIANGLKELTRVTLAVNGNKPPKIPLAPYPETAIQRLKSERKRAYKQGLSASLVFTPEPPT